MLERFFVMYFKSGDLLPFGWIIAVRSVSGLKVIFR